MPEGVQGWDRYGYVNNNPVKYTDPSGHDVGCAGIDMGMCGIYGKSFAGWYRQAEPYLEKIIKKGNTLTYNELMETFGNIPQLTASMKAISMRYKPNNNIIQSNERDQNDAIFHFIEFAMDIHNYFEILENSSNWAKPIYKQTKYVLPLGGFEYVIDAGLQFSNDYNNYPFYQAVQRSFIVAAGSWTTDVTSIIGGGYGGIMGEVINPTFGGSVGYGIIAYLTSAAIDSQFQTSWYPMIFKKLGLGSYP